MQSSKSSFLDVLHVHSTSSLRNVPIHQTQLQRRRPSQFGVRMIRLTRCLLKPDGLHTRLRFGVLASIRTVQTSSILVPMMGYCEVGIYVQSCPVYPLGMPVIQMTVQPNRSSLAGMTWDALVFWPAQVQSWVGRLTTRS